MKRKIPSAQPSEEELPFSFKKAEMGPEKIMAHWQRISDQLAPGNDSEGHIPIAPESKEADEDKPKEQ